MTPFQAVYGRLPPIVPRYEPGSTSVEALESLLLERDNLLRELKDHLHRVQQRMAQKANIKRRDVEFQPGDLVWVKLQPYRQISVSRRSSPKLAKRFFGPYPIVERIGPVAYKLELPAGSRVHPVFHISLLKPFFGTSTGPLNPLPTDMVGRPVLEPLVVVSSRVVIRDGQPERQVLVQWQGLPPEAATWESLADFSDSFPSFDLGDKVTLKAGGVDTTGEANRVEEEEIVQHEVGPLGEKSQIEQQEMVSLAKGRPRRKVVKPSRFN